MGKKIGVGLIGVGRRGYDLAECILRQRDQVGLELRALYNRSRVRAERARERLLSHFGESESAPEITIYDEYQSVVDDPDIDLVMICTPQYAHKEPAIAAVRSGKRVYLDKPLAHDLQDALEIYREQVRTGNQIIMSFTRRFEDPWIKTFRMVTEDQIIGPVRMIHVRNVIPYHTYFHTWHRKMEWSGGALADKMSHIFDVFNWYAQDEPVRLTAFGGQALFVADSEAPERCSACDRVCPYRVAEFHGAGAASSDTGQKEEQARERPDAMVDLDDTRLEESEVIKRHDTCVWYPGGDINDHGVVNVEYRNGVKASLFWTLFGPDADDQETMELVGDKGRIILTRHVGKIDIVTDHGARHEVLDQRSDGFGRSHFGADDNFIFELDRFCNGEKPSVTADEGLLASRMVEAAHRSIQGKGALVNMTEVEEVVWRPGVRAEVLGR